MSSNGASSSESASSGVVQEIRDSPLDIVVHRGDGRDLIVKADDSVLLIDDSEASILIKELQEKMEEGA